MFFNGLPEMPIDNVSVKDVVISQAKEGIVISQAKGVTIDNVRIEAKKGENLVIRNAYNVMVNGQEYNNETSKSQPIAL